MPVTRRLSISWPPDARAGTSRVTSVTTLRCSAESVRPCLGLCLCRELGPDIVSRALGCDGGSLQSFLMEFLAAQVAGARGFDDFCS